MRDAAPSLARRFRGGLFVLCAACTVWLMVQNAALLSWVGLGHGGASLLQEWRTALVTIVGIASVTPFAFALGWLAARATGRPGRVMEARHE